MLRCLIVDDNPYFLRAARCLLEHQSVTVVGMASNGTDAVRMAELLKPDVALVDIDLGVECGLDLADRLQREAPAPLPVILISSHAEEDYAELIEASPAVGFVSKAVLSGDAIRAAVGGVDDSRRDDPVEGPAEG
ncbi:response regulator transcription factor [Streptomyces sp. NPDC005209]|uniref:response regulator transcription factor n=1 Tax=Streptomyces sp. NPDC005209 TaxID=3156715 RepID=UPI0033A51206